MRPREEGRAVISRCSRLGRSASAVLRSSVRASLVTLLLLFIHVVTREARAEATFGKCRRRRRSSSSLKKDSHDAFQFLVETNQGISRSDFPASSIADKMQSRSG